MSTTDDLRLKYTKYTSTHIHWINRPDKSAAFTSQEEAAHCGRESSYSCYDSTCIEYQYPLPCHSFERLQVLSRQRAGKAADMTCSLPGREESDYCVAPVPAVTPSQTPLVSPQVLQKEVTWTYSTRFILLNFMGQPTTHAQLIFSAYICTVVGQEA